MIKENLNEDDFLRKMMHHVPLDSPSDDFVEKVMAGIKPALIQEPARKPLFQHLKSFFPYALLVLVLFTVIMTSDLPFLNWIPGKNYLNEGVLPYLGVLWSSLGKLFTSKYVTFGLLISASAGVLFLTDHYLGNKINRQRSSV